LRFKVPQNIDMPDRILGPLTMIQFVEAVLGGGLAYVCFGSLPKPLNQILAVLILLFTAAVVFLKINERPFLYYFVAFLRFIITPKKRVWHKDSSDGFEVEIYKPQKTENPQFVSKGKTKEDFEKMAQKLDSQNFDKIKLK